MADYLTRSSRRLRAGLFLLSAATLAYEINLTRLFSVAQFYHFAFMIVSLALLGFGAAGSFLAFFPRLGSQHPSRAFSRLALGCAAAMLGAYLLVNELPFDSFSLALDHRQPFILGLHYRVRCWEVLCAMLSPLPVAMSWQGTWLYSPLKPGCSWWQFSCLGELM